MKSKTLDLIHNWLAQNKIHLSPYGLQKINEILGELNSSFNLEEFTKSFPKIFSIQVTKRINALENAKDFFSLEIEKLGFHHMSYDSKIEFFSELRSDIDSIYLIVIQKLKDNQHSLNDIEASLEVIKRLTQFSIFEMEEEKNQEIETIRFNFINRLKLLLYCKDEGINALVDRLKADEQVVNRFNEDIKAN